VVESARVGLEAQAMAFGPAAGGLWDVAGNVVAIGLLVLAVIVILQLAAWFFASHMDPRAVGLLLFVGAAGAVVLGIGWGRSGFHRDMGLAWRYGWLTAPAVWAAYFTWLVPGGRVSTYGPAALAIGAAVLFPVNEGSGFRDAEYTVRPFEIAWEADVRDGLTAGQVVNRHFPNAGASFRHDVIDAMHRMRDHRYTYYESLGTEVP
jgi:hypothetical protein